MKIIGGKDYYDVGLSMGIDPSVMLIRGKSKDVPVEKAGGGLLSRHIVVREKARWGAEGGESVAVVFCGKIYRGFLVPGKFIPGQEQPWNAIWNAEKFWSWVRQREAQKNPVHVAVTGSWRYTRRGRKSDMTVEQFFTPEPLSDEMRQWMILHRVSIMVEKLPRRSEYPCFEINPCSLKQLGFAKAVDPWTAFQELSMWIGGVLGGTSPEIVAIKDDKVLIEGHGFDNRFSFRGPRLA